MGCEPRFWDNEAVGRHVPLPGQLQIIDAFGRCGAVVVVMLTLVGELLIGASRLVDTAAQAETLSRNVERDERLNFNIPSQPLGDAIYAYTAFTGIEALAPGALLANRRSTEVHGTLAADEALQALLTGTGLTARFVDSGSFTLTPMQPPSTAAPAADAPSDLPRFAQYSAMLQKAVKRVLCQQSDTRPGDYRTAVQIWIAPSGAVARSVLVGSTGDAARDKALSDLFATLSIGAPPPAGLPQPATLLILPRAQASDCTSVGVAGRP